FFGVQVRPRENGAQRRAASSARSSRAICAGSAPPGKCTSLRRSSSPRLIGAEAELVGPWFVWLGTLGVETCGLVSALPLQESAIKQAEKKPSKLAPRSRSIRRK